MVSPKQEYLSIQRGMMSQANTFGQIVDWHVFSGYTNEDPVYDEAGRTWAQPVRLPVYSVTRVQAAERDEPAGTYQEEAIRIVVVPEIWRLRGLPDATDEQSRVRDRVTFEGKLFSVDNFQVQGRIATRPTVYFVEASQVQPDEQFLDA